MSKLNVYIYSNRVPFEVRQKFYGFKSLVKFGTDQQISKSPFSGDFSKIMPKVFFFAGILFENIESCQK